MGDIRRCSTHVVFAMQWQSTPKGPRQRTAHTAEPHMRLRMLSPLQITRRDIAFWPPIPPPAIARDNPVTARKGTRSQNRSFLGISSVL